MRPEEIFSKMYSGILQIFGGGRCLIIAVYIIFIFLSLTAAGYTKGLVSGAIFGIPLSSFFEISKDTLREIFIIIAQSLLLGFLLLFGPVAMSLGDKYKGNAKKLSEIWKEIFKVINLGFFVGILNLIFLIFLDLIVNKNFGLPILFLILSLTMYSFYSAVRRIEKAFL